MSISASSILALENSGKMEGTYRSALQCSYHRSAADAAAAAAAARTQEDFDP